MNRTISLFTKNIISSQSRSGRTGILRARCSHDSSGGRTTGCTAPEGFWSVIRRNIVLGVGGALIVGSTFLFDVNTASAYATGQARTAESNVPIKEAFLASKEPVPNSADFSPEELATIKLFQRNTPTVVNISNIINARTPYSTNVLKIPAGTGSGFVYKKDDKVVIVTNYHVVRGAANLKVSLIDQSVYSATVIGGDPSKDIAVLKLDAPREVLMDLKPVELGTSSNLFVGQRVYAIGNPFGLDHTLTSGIISGLNRELPTGNGPPLRNVIQTDAAINPGNSGGVLLDGKGNLIGINTAIADPSGKGSSSGIGFAIPIDTVKGLVDQILMYGRVIRPSIGITIAPPQALRQLGMTGVMILDVPEGTPASKAGLQGLSRDSYGRILLGDVIVGIKTPSGQMQQISSERELFIILDACKVGDTIEVDVLRRGTEKKSFKIVLKERNIISE